MSGTSLAYCFVYLEFSPDAWKNMRCLSCAPAAPIDGAAMNHISAALFRMSEVAQYMALLSPLLGMSARIRIFRAQARTVAHNQTEHAEVCSARSAARFSTRSIDQICRWSWALRAPSNRCHALPQPSMC